MKKDSHPANSSPRQGENYPEVLKQCNDLLLEQKRRLEEDLEKQRKLCTLLKLKVRELADANRAFGAERKIQATEIARLTAQVQKGHEKIFNTAFTAGITMSFSMMMPECCIPQNSSRRNLRQEKRRSLRKSEPFS